MGENIERIFILIILNLIVYFRLLRYGYIIDDNCIPQGKGKNFLQTFWWQLTSRKYSNLQVEHLQRLAVHIINSCLIYIAFGKTDVSFLAALLFSVNPWGNQVPCWLNAIGYGMSCMLVLLMVIFKGWAWVFYLFTLLWHLTPAFAPFLFLYIGPWQKVFIIIPYMLIVFLSKGRVPLYKVQDNATMFERGKYATWPLTHIYPKKFIFIVKTYAYYTLNILFPRRLGLFHIFGYSFGLATTDTNKWQKVCPLFFAGIGLMITNLYLIIRFWGTPLSLGLFWYNLFIGQWCNFVILYQTITDRYSYLAQVGMMLALAYILSIMPYGYYIAAVFLTFYTTKLSYYLPAFKSMEDYIDMNLVEFPDNYACWNWVGILESGKNRKFSAIRAWAKGLHYRPNDYRLNFNLGQLLRIMGYLDEAEKYLYQAGLALQDEKRLDRRLGEVQAIEEALGDIKRRKAEIKARRAGIIIDRPEGGIIKP